MGSLVLRGGNSSRRSSVDTGMQEEDSGLGLMEVVVGEARDRVESSGTPTGKLDVSGRVCFR